MATSSSYDFSVTRDDIFIDAFGAIGIGNEGESLTGNMKNRASRLLNMIVQQLSGRPDMAPNMKVWTREHSTLFLQKDQYEYSLGPASTDDHATSDSYVSTTLSAAASSGAGTLTVTSITGISSGDYVGVLMDSGSWHWTTVNGAPSGSTVTLTDVTTGAAASGKTVYTYTNKIQKPLDIIEMNRRESNGDDTPLDSLILSQYHAIPDKDADGEPTAFYYEEKVAIGKLFFDTAPTDATDVIKFVYLRPIQDFDAATDNPEFPKVWFRALVYMLAVDLAPVYGKPVSNDLKELKAEAMGIVRQEDPEKVVVYFEPKRHIHWDSNNG